MVIQTKMNDHDVDDDDGDDDDDDDDGGGGDYDAAAAADDDDDDGGGGDGGDDDDDDGGGGDDDDDDDGAGGSGGDDSSDGGGDDEMMMMMMMMTMMMTMMMMMVLVVVVVVMIVVMVVVMMMMVTFSSPILNIHGRPPAHLPPTISYPALHAHLYAPARFSQTEFLSHSLSSPEEHSSMSWGIKKRNILKRFLLLEKESELKPNPNQARNRTELKPNPNPTKAGPEPELEPNPNPNSLEPNRIRGPNPNSYLTRIRSRTPSNPNLLSALLRWRVRNFHEGEAPKTRGEGDTSAFYERALTRTLLAVSLVTRLASTLERAFGVRTDSLHVACGCSGRAFINICWTRTRAK